MDQGAVGVVKVVEYAGKDQPTGAWRRTGTCGLRQSPACVRWSFTTHFFFYPLPCSLPVAHFKAHSSSISTVLFDDFGILLATADETGQELHVYSLGTPCHTSRSFGRSGPRVGHTCSRSTMNVSRAHRFFLSRPLCPPPSSPRRERRQPAAPLHTAQGHYNGHVSQRDV